VANPLSKKNLKLPHKVESLEQLKQIAIANTVREGEAVPLECVILLNFGARSSKRVDYFPGQYGGTGTWDILNYIDSTWDEDLSDAQLQELTMIPEAIEKGAFFVETIG